MPSPADPKTFAGKFLEKLSKISREEIELFLARLQSEKSFFETVLNHLLEGVVVTDPKGRILFINRRGRLMLALREKQRILGEALLNHVEPGEMSDLLRGYDPVRDKILIREVAYGREERILQVTLIPIRGEAETLAAIVTLLEDQTTQRHEEAQRIQAERIASLATLTSGVAHEIKNPLNSLNIHAHLARKTLAQPEAALRKGERERGLRSVEIIIEEIERLSRVVDEFLLAARPTKPQFEIKSVNDVLRRLADLMEAEVEQRGIQVDMELDIKIAPSRIDEMQLILAFRNLVKNSLEAINHDNGRISIRSRLTAGNIVVEFSDNGPGIPADQVGKVFEPYVTNKFSGTGLGLMIVYRIISEHGGHVTLRSDEGQGTTVRIALPLGPGPRRLLPERT